jgi:hypothetical protein
MTFSTGKGSKKRALRLPAQVFASLFSVNFRVPEMPSGGIKTALSFFFTATRFSGRM